jgi:oxygen-independent coproporphyrinogen-3 oxidase
VSAEPVAAAPAASGIYVHLPYCASRCGYCAFVVTTDPSSQAAYLTLLAKEAELVASEASRAVFDTVYLGGGTPSLLPPGEIARLLEMLRGGFAIAEDAEVTLEANPEDVFGERVRAWSAAGVNRVSVGVQSLSDRELAAVGRRHDARRAREAVATLVAAGLSVSGDLILGLPDQTAESFLTSAAELAGSGVGHLSVYLLEVEKSKVMEEDRRARPERYLGDDAQADAWLALAALLAGRGFHHYEISNWARPGRQARHNLKYWTRTETLGLGVSAHELWAGRRRANVSSLPAYLEALESGRRPVALDEKLTAAAEAREAIVLGLRLSEGVPRSAIREAVAAASDPLLEDDFAGWLAAGVLVEDGDRTRLSERGFLVSNEILCRFV